MNGGGTSHTLLGFAPCAYSAPASCYPSPRCCSGPLGRHNDPHRHRSKSGPSWCGSHHCSKPSTWRTSLAVNAVAGPATRRGRGGTRGQSQGSIGCYMHSRTGVSKGRDLIDGFGSQGSGTRAKGSRRPSSLCDCGCWSGVGSP